MGRSDRPSVVWTVACLLLLVLMLVSAEALVDLAVMKDHAGLSFERAVEIIRTSSDPDLRAGARFALDNDLRRALEVLRADPESWALLDAWATLLR